MGSRSCMIGVWTRTFFESLLFRRPPIKLYLSIQSFVLLQLAAWLGLCTRFSPPTCSFLLFFHSSSGTPVVSIVAQMNDESSTLYHRTCLSTLYTTPLVCTYLLQYEYLWYLLEYIHFILDISCIHARVLLCCLMNNNLLRRILYSGGSWWLVII